MFLSLFLIQGLVGFGLWCGLAYAMGFSNLALGVVCVLVLFSPLFFMAVWAPLMIAAVLSEPTIVKGEVAVGLAHSSAHESPMGFE